MYERKGFPIVNKGSLKKIALTHSLRCDSKQFEAQFIEYQKMLDNEDFFYLGELLPKPLIKGIQPFYIEGTEGVPVINTLSIQQMRINTEACRYISEEDFESISVNRKLKKNDVLLTLDGGTSIGKPVLFQLEGDYTVDSHVAILRPVGISSLALVYLLASPLGQMHFSKAESGASGQTSVTEEDLRRFKFPQKTLLKLERASEILDTLQIRLQQEKAAIDKKIDTAWIDFIKKIT